MHRRRVAVVLVAAALLVIAVLAVGLVPVATGDLGAHPRPAADYVQAVQRFDAIRAAEGPDVVADCHSRLLTEGRRTAEVYILFHGLTNCPRQMVELADRLHATGANVLIIRAPGHGQTNGPEGGAVVEAGGLRDMADASTDIAAGLGDRVTAVGLSLGGLLSTWAVLQRPEVQRAVIIAPAYDLGGYPGLVREMLPNLFSRLPNIVIPSAGQPLGDHAYPETPTHAVGEMLRLGRFVRAEAAERPPADKQIVFIINDADTTISNAAVLGVADGWRRAGVDVTIVRIPAALGLPHDVIDMAQDVRRPDVVYPLVIAVAEGRQPPALPQR